MSDPAAPAPPTDAPDDQWTVGWDEWSPDDMARRETLLSLSNGNLGWRGTLDEGDPCHTSGAYLNGVFERHPMPYAEEGYGYPEYGETAVEIPDGKIIRLMVDDEPFDIGRGQVLRHTQRVDMRTGILTRAVEWVSPAGAHVEIRSARIVSLSHRSVGAVSYRVTPRNRAAEITLVSEIVANQPPPDLHPDARVMEVLTAPFESVGQHVAGDRATLVHRTRRSRIGVAVAMVHSLEGDQPATASTEVDADLARSTITTRLRPGECIRLVKYVGHEWSATADDTSLRDRAETACTGAMDAGWDALVAQQRGVLADVWRRADVVLDGAPAMQRAVRFALFQVIQAGARVEGRSVPGKGLTGSGYEGHTFWDADAFVLPVLSHLAPHSAAEALRWRHSTLDHARGRARHLHLAGAAFAWRTIDGPECSGYWPASTAAFHVNAAIAAAVEHHVRITGDVDFEREVGVDLLVETARLWPSLGRWDRAGVFHIDGVTGPDEYSALVDDNLYTNMSAQRNLRAAAAAARRHADVAGALDVTDDEVDEWMRVAGAIGIPFDVERDVHQQSAGFTERQRWDFAGTPPERYPLQEHYPYFDLYRTQVIKQADLVLALQFFPEAFSDDETARAFAYYEALTVRDSSLSAPAQAVVAARTGHLPLAWDYLEESALIDLWDLRDEVEDGLHIAALAGVWTALTAGFGGLRHGEDGILEFRPRLTPPMTGLRFGIPVRGGLVRVSVRSDRVTYEVEGPDAITIRHFGEEATVAPGAPVEKATPPLADPGPPPRQPSGRAPSEIVARRRDGDS